LRIPELETRFKITMKIAYWLVEHVMIVEKVHSATDVPTSSVVLGNLILRVQNTII